MKVNEIMRLLPHDYPMLMVDRVIEVDPGKSILGYKNISINEQLFVGHFPETPIFPGVLIIEAMAQISGILGFVTAQESSDNGMLYLFAMPLSVASRSISDCFMALEYRHCCPCVSKYDFRKSLSFVQVYYFKDSAAFINGLR